MSDDLTSEIDGNIQRWIPLTKENPGYSKYLFGKSQHADSMNDFSMATELARGREGAKIFRGTDTIFRGTHDFPGTIFRGTDTNKRFSGGQTPTILTPTTIFRGQTPTNDLTILSVPDLCDLVCPRFMIYDFVCPRFMRFDVWQSRQL